MNPQRDGLSEALRELAGASPEASAQLGDRLNSAFVRHHMQRRRKRTAIVLGLAACLVMSVYWLRPRSREAVKVDQPAAQTAQLPPVSAQQKNGNVGHASVEPKTIAPEIPRPPAPSVARASAKPQGHAKAKAEPGSRDVEASAAPVNAGDFVALPSFDPAILLGESRMVRMDLPGSALQLIGYPVEGQLLDRRFVTDVLVGQDGMPYAVRLVQTRNLH